MTTWESIDKIEKIDTEDITVTSDEAFKRVTSDEGFIDEWKEWYLKQNTAWLIQEIPNISFLDISDTMLESQKTLYDRENWILRVGKAWRSIETQPQDTMTVWQDEDKTYIVSPWYTDNYIDFDWVDSSQNYTTVRPDNTVLPNVYTFDILQDWIYTISYWWTLETNSATWFKIIVWKLWTNPWIIIQDYYQGSSLPEIMSWWKQKTNIELKKWDSVYMKVQANDAIKIYKETYLSIKFQQYKL